MGQPDKTAIVEFLAGDAFSLPHLAGLRLVEWESNVINYSEVQVTPLARVRQKSVSRFVTGFLFLPSLFVQGNDESNTTFSEHPMTL